MKTSSAFFLKTTLISLPFAVLLFCALLLYAAGEYSSLDEVITRQDASETLVFGPAYSNPDIEYKYKNVLRKKPEILVVGTSRTMQFHASSFRQSFYNAGGIINRISQIPILLGHLKADGYLPETIVLGLDQYFFNAAWDPVSYDHDYEARIIRTDISMSPNPIIILKDLMKKKIEFRSVFLSEGIGINAKVNRNGFTSDGTYYYGGFFEKGIEWDADFSDTYSRIRNGTMRFEYGSEVNERALIEFRKISSFCSENDIKLICFLPPFAPSVWQQMQETRKYSYIMKIVPSLSDIINGVPNQYVFDFSYLDGSRDEDFVDGFHGGDELYRVVTERMPF